MNQHTKIFKQFFFHIIYLLIFPISILAFSTTTNQVFAGDFNYDTSMNIDYTPGDDFVTVTERLTIRVDNAIYYYPGGVTNDFTLTDYDTDVQSERIFKQTSLEVFRNGHTTTDYSIQDIEGGFSIMVIQNRDIQAGSSYEVSIRYKTHELVDLNGNIINLYIPGLAEGTQFEIPSPESGTVTSFSYSTSLSVPATAPAASFIYPNNVDISRDNNSTIYRISNQNLLGKTVWLQLGTVQYNYFNLVQTTPKTDTIIPTGISQLSNLLSTNVYRISLPRDFDETNQQTYYTTISPTPTRIETDEEGNTIATFEVPANIDSEIIIEGYIVTKSFAKDDPQKIPIPVVNYSAYLNEIGKDTSLEKYTYPSSYWQSDDSNVQQISQDLLVGNETLMDVILADYNYIVEHFDYSMEKLDSGNERMGAVAALSGAPAVCMEYADSLTAILRAQGIASRAAFGYGNDPILDENDTAIADTSLEQLGHQWVQVWIPNYGWLSIDPTWGESDKTYIGGDLDHILWYTVASLNDEIILYDSVMYSANPSSTNNIEGFSLDIQAVKEGEVPDLKTLQTIQDITNSSSSTKPFINEDVDFYIKTTLLGKAIIVVTPVCLLIIVVLTVVGITTSVIRKAKRLSKGK